MSNTNPKDFLKFINLLPKEIIDNMWFIPLWSDSKLPQVRDDLKFNTKYKLSSDQAYLRLKNGSNVGMYALPGGLMYLDLDVKKGQFLASDTLIDRVMNIPTVTIKSRNGGIQKYFLNDQIHANQLIKEKGVIVGELRVAWQYVVSIGSSVPIDEDNRYGSGIYTRDAKYSLISEFNGVYGLDPLILIEDKKQKITKKEKSMWNSDLVQADKISMEDYKILTQNRARR